MQQLRQLYKDRTGAALIEFALILPFMALLLFGGLELTNFIIANQKVEKAGYVLTDVTTQFKEQSATVPRDGELTESDLMNDVFPQLTRMLGDGSDPSKQVVILTSVRKEGTVEKVKWQVVGGGTLSEDVVSQVNGRTPAGINPGVRDTAASLPADVVRAMDSVADGDNVIVGEVFMRYEPVFSTGIIPARTISKSIYLHPRNDNAKLVCLPPNFVYDECVGGPAYAAVTCPSSGACVGLDYVTRNCDGFVSSTTECAASCGAVIASACEGNDFVSRNCKGTETARLTNNTSQGCMAVCSTTLNQCTSGTAGSINAGSCGGNATWTCTGAGGGTANCTLANAACPPNSQPGACGSEYNTCAVGTASNGEQNTQCGGASTWRCSGTNGGAATNCRIANPACPSVPPPEQPVSANCRPDQCDMAAIFCSADQKCSQDTLPRDVARNAAQFGLTLCSGLCVNVEGTLIGDSGVGDAGDAWAGPTSTSVCRMVDGRPTVVPIGLIGGGPGPSNCR